MGRYILKRCLWLIPVILGVCIFIFTIMYFVPGDPAQLILGPGASESELQVKRAELGLNDSYLTRLLRYMRDVFLRFDFGRSYLTGIKITDEIVNRIPKTFLVGFVSIALSLLVGIPLGVKAAVNQNGWADRICMLLAILGISVPEFWLALMLVILFALKLGILPASGIVQWTGYILPWIALSFGGLAALARQSRSSMLEVIRSDYITTARAKGVSEHDVIYKHALPNALIPVVAIAGSRLAGIFGGSVVIETVFSIPGLGTYLVNAISNRDYPVVQGCVLFLAITFSLAMLLVDLAYAFIDPKIKAQYISQSGRRHRHGRHGYRRHHGKREIQVNA
ncbi:MAG: ABC transporter permease [Treponema sp.]|jgi:peptide/nickel transport system permease protein|nr:ABC transporter permease [Treponema sp.]